MEKVQGNYLACPICLEIPPTEIFQCINGHVICLACSNRVAMCPQCKVAFGGIKIRNRALEDLIGSMEISCSYKSEGCQAQILRKDATVHASSCEFRPFQFCKLLGLPCEYGSASGDDIFAHIKREHKVVICENNVRALKMDSELGLMKRKVKLDRVTLYDLQTSGSQPAKFLVRRWTETSAGYLKAICVHFSSSKGLNKSPFLLTLNVSVRDKHPRWLWTGAPTHYKDFDKVKLNPPFSVPIQNLLDLWEKDEKPNVESVVTFHEE